MWTWIINAAVYIGVLVCYFMVDGHEMVYAIYLPLDFFLNCSKASYYFLYYYRDAQREKKAAHLKEVLSKYALRRARAAIAAQLGNMAANFGGNSLVQGSDELTPEEARMKLQYQEALESQRKRTRLLAETKEKDLELDLEVDTYTMAFKALHFDSMRQMELNPDDVHGAFHAALFVFVIQCILIFILALIIFTGSEGFNIYLPSDIYILISRFVCSILMHLQVESDMRQGLQMMKYVTNHSKDFSNPYYAFLVALMQSLGGLGSEFFCIIFLCSLTDPITILIRFIAFASIGKIDNFYAAALPSEHRLQRESQPLAVKRHRFETEKEGHSCGSFTARLIYKTIRIMYASFIFYFLPYMALFYPQIVKHEDVAAH